MVTSISAALSNDRILSLTILLLSTGHFQFGLGDSGEKGSSPGEKVTASYSRLRPALNPSPSVGLGAVLPMRQLCRLAQGHSVVPLASLSCAYPFALFPAFVSHLRPLPGFRHLRGTGEENEVLEWDPSDPSASRLLR